MVKPIYWLSFVLSLMVLSSAPLSASCNFNTNIDTEERSHPKTSSTTSSNNVMDLTINCISVIPTLYLDQNGELILDPYDFANPMNPNCDSIALLINIDTVRCNDIPSVPAIEIMAVDTCGNTDMCSFMITVLDTLPPVLTCPNDTILVSPMDSCGTYVMLDSADVTDNCFFDTLYNSYALNNKISGVYPVGVTTIKFYGEDSFDNIDSCTFTVTVHDFNNPNIVCPPPPTSEFSCRADLPKAYTSVASFRAFGGIVDDSCGINEASWSFREEMDLTKCPIKVTRWYSVEDVNGNIDSCSHELFVNDEFLDLMVLVPADVTFSADPGLCEADIVLAEPTVNKTCGVSISRMPAGNVFDVGTTPVVWTITDGCGETQMVNQNVIIEDNENPSLTCSGAKNVSLTNSPSNTLSKNSFIVDVDDNCGLKSTGISRMDGGCVPGDDLPDFEVNFCCSDADTDVMVVVTVEDMSGNLQSCMVSVAVTDETGPELVEGLPDITVSCDFFIDLLDLTPFGEIKFKEADRDSIKIDDELYDGKGIDGLATDNCDVDVLTASDTYVDNRVNNQGTIERTITITDSKGRTVTDLQVITITDTDVLTLSDIQFPNDTTIMGGCDASLEPGVTGEPIIFDDDICTMPAYDKEDLVFDDPDTGCRMVKRTWTVIDMSQFVPNTNEGRWTSVQYITLMNTEAPTIQSGCQDTMLCAPNASCEGNGMLTVTATDDCTAPEDMYYKYFVDLNGDGTIDYEGENDTLIEFFPAGAHIVKWKVEDRCGNLTTCEFNVTMQECKAPTPVCLNGLSIDLNNIHTAEMWASDFNNHSYDNCTANGDLNFSFSEDVNDKNIVFTCDDKGDQPLNIYVTDKAGNQSFCSTHVLVTDNVDPCPKDTEESDLTFRVGGKVSTEEEVTISETLLEITDGNEAKVIYSNTIGGYMFIELPDETDYVLDASKNDQCMEGISTLDLVLIQRHILGQQSLSSPYKLIAADVNNSNSISASDLVELRKMILGINSKFSNSDCWLFVDKYYTFDDESYPWDYPKTTTIENLDIDMLSSDFVAVKVGDVNGSVSNIHDTKPDNRSSKMIQMTTKDIVFEDGDNVEIPLRVHSDVDVLALQANFSFDAEALTFVGLESSVLDIKPSFYHAKESGKEGNIAIAYSDVSAITVREGQEIIKLKFVAKKSNKLSAVFTENSSGPLQSVIYNKEEEMQYLQYDYDVEYLIPMEIGSASPNPFVNETFVPITVAYDMPLEVSLYDQAGSLIYKTYDEYVTGIHYFEVNETILKGKSGVFYLHVAGAEMKEIRKLIKIK